MEISDQNSLSNNPLGRKFGQEVGGRTRRALGEIHGNAIREHRCPQVVHKRGLSTQGKDELHGKNPLMDRASRPVTRKFVAELASTRQHFPPPEAKKAKIIPEKNEFSDCIFIDDVDGDRPEPMFLESPQQLKTDINNEDNQMEEVEMEDIDEEEAIIDIDSHDKNNQLAAVEYVEDLYSYYRKMESLSCVPADYMARQADINDKMRAILVDWLVEVHDKFGLMPETLFLTVNIIDRFLSQQSMVRKKLQLVGLVAMLLACKYEEVSVPVVEDLVLISDNAYGRKEILEMESLVLNTLQFNMSLPTPYVFLRRFLKAADLGTKVCNYRDLIESGFSY